MASPVGGQVPACDPLGCLYASLDAPHLRQLADALLAVLERDPSEAELRGIIRGIASWCTALALTGRRRSSPWAIECAHEALTVANGIEEAWQEHETSHEIRDDVERSSRRDQSAGRVEVLRELVESLRAGVVYEHAWRRDFPPAERGVDS